MKKISLNGLLVAAVVLTLNSAACADLTETVTTRISTASIGGKANEPYSSTTIIYKSGDKVKTVNLPGQTAIGIIDLGSSTATVLFPETKTKILVPDHSLLAVNIPSAKVVDTKQTKMILGHQAHLFKFSLKGPGSTRTGYAWIAANIPAPPQSESFVSVIVDAVSLSHQFPAMRGTWLKASVVSLSPGINMKISVFYEVTTLSNALIPASTFEIPQDYTITDYTKAPPAGVPS